MTFLVSYYLKKVKICALTHRVLLLESDQVLSLVQVFTFHFPGKQSIVLRPESYSIYRWSGCHIVYLVNLTAGCVSSCAAGTHFHRKVALHIWGIEWSPGFLKPSHFSCRCSIIAVGWDNPPSWNNSVGNIDGAMIWLISAEVSGHHKIERKELAELSQTFHIYSF